MDNLVRMGAAVVGMRKEMVVLVSMAMDLLPCTVLLCLNPDLTNANIGRFQIR